MMDGRIVRSISVKFDKITLTILPVTKLETENYKPLIFFFHLSFYRKILSYRGMLGVV